MIIKMKKEINKYGMSRRVYFVCLEVMEGRWPKLMRFFVEKLGWMSY